jgi:hypothetical protein
MPTGKTIFRWRPTAHEIRWLIYLVIFLSIAAWRFLPRQWHPILTIETGHLKIYSTATQRQTDDMARVLELLYVAYSNRLGAISGFQREHPRLQLKLYKDRAEMRRINPGMGWAEAFYLKPFCLAYFSADEINPYHWMLHESIHQLNAEIAHLNLVQWLDEGIAEYFSTSRILSGELAVGRIDPNTYPVWWIDDLAIATNLEANIANGSVIPLRAIITNHGGPNINDKFNLYYLHWWTLAHFIFESEKYRGRGLALLQQGGGLEAFEKNIGPVEQVQAEWHEYVRRLKATLNRGSRKYSKSIKLKPYTITVTESAK